MKPAKWVRLIGPIQVTQTASISMGVVLGGIMVCNDDLYRIFRHTTSLAGPGSLRPVERVYKGKRAAVIFLSIRAATGMTRHQTDSALPDAQSVIAPCQPQRLSLLFIRLS